MEITKETISKARAWFASASTLDLQGIELRDYQVESGWASYLHDTLVRVPPGARQVRVPGREARVGGELGEARVGGDHGSSLPYAMI